MAKSYCFKCGHCGLQFESRYPYEDIHFEEGESCGPVVRDYKEENAQMNIANLKGR